MAAGDLTTTANVKQYLSITDAGDDTLIGRLVSAMSQWFINQVHRNIITQDYTETFDGDNARVRIKPYMGPWLYMLGVGARGYAITLKHYPVQKIYAVVVDGQRVNPRAPNLTAAVVGTAGTLATATRYYRVSWFDKNNVESIAGNELAAVVVGPSGSVALAWDLVPDATRYRVYVGAAPGGQLQYFDVGNVLAFSDTGTAATAGTPPTFQNQDGWVLDQQMKLIIAGVSFGFTHGVDNCEVQYSAGFGTSAPADVEQAVIELVAWRYRERQRIGVQSKTIGSETIMFQTYAAPQSVLTVIDSYRRFNV